MKTPNVLQTKTMQTSTNSQDQSQRGQALVEFALVLMFVILPFTFVLVDGALTLFTLANVTNAAREGARAGSIFQYATAPSGGVSFSDQVAAIDNGRYTFVQQESAGMLGPLVAFSECQKIITYQPCSGSLCVSGRPDLPQIGNPYREMDSLTFRLACPRRLLFGLVGTGVVTLTSEATMKIEPGGTCPPDPDDPTKCDDGISP